MLSSLDALGAKDGRQLKSFRKFLTVVGWAVSAISGAKVALSEERFIISVSIC